MILVTLDSLPDEVVFCLSPEMELDELIKTVKNASSITKDNSQSILKIANRVKANDTITVSRVVGNLVKFHNLIYSGHLHEYLIKEGFFKSWGWKSSKKACQQHHRLTVGIILIPQAACSVTNMVQSSNSDLHMWGNLLEIQ